MRSRGPLPLAAVAGTVTLVCAVAPVLPWVVDGDGPRHCGWTCYVPLGSASAAGVDTLGGDTGTAVSPVLSVLLAAVALLALTVLIAAIRRRTVPAAGWALAGTGMAAAVWGILVIVHYTEGNRLAVIAPHRWFFAHVGPGPIVAVVGAAGAVLLGGSVALGTWALADADSLAAATAVGEGAQPEASPRGDARAAPQPSSSS